MDTDDVVYIFGVPVLVAKGVDIGFTDRPEDVWIVSLDLEPGRPPKVIDAVRITNIGNTEQQQ